MKKLFFLFAFLGLVSIATNAQTTKKSCNPAACTKAKDGKTCSSKTDAAAIKMADSDASIEKKVCPKSGKVSFVRKSICPNTKKVSYTDVEYCSKSEKFVNVSPKSSVKEAAVKTACDTQKSKGTATAEKASCSKGAAKDKACCASKKGTDAKTCSKNAKSKTCAKGANGKACCADKKKGVTKVKKEKTENRPTSIIKN